MHYRSNRKAVAVARLLYLIVSIFTGIIISFLFSEGDSNLIWLGVIIGVLIGVFFIFVESLSKQFSIRGFSTATFGLAIGLCCAWLLQTVNLPFIFLVLIKNIESSTPFSTDPDIVTLAFNTVLFSALGYIGTVLALRTNQDDFAIVIPFIRFRQDGITDKSVVCCIDALIDARIIKLVELGFISKNLILPPNTLEELILLTTSADEVEKLQGERGLQTINKLKSITDVKVTSHSFEMKGSGMDSMERATLTSKQLNASLVTANTPLAKMAIAQDVSVLNLAELERASSPEIQIGQDIKLTFVKVGKEKHQAVGYSYDGSMIVVNDAAKLIGTAKKVTITSQINTSAGTMNFAEIAQEI